jgi:hypothetical protein
MIPQAWSRMLDAGDAGPAWRGVRVGGRGN